MKRYVLRSNTVIKVYFTEVSEFVNYTKLQGESYATSNLIMTMGKK